MTYVAIGFGLVIAAGLVAILCAVFRIDFGEAMRLHWRRGIVRGFGVWPVLGVVAMIALVVDPDGATRTLAFIGPPGSEADVQRLMPRAIGVFVGAGAFVVGAGVVLRAILWTPGKGPEAEEQEEAKAYD